VVGFKAVERARQLLLVWQEPEVYSPGSWWHASDAATCDDVTRIVSMWRNTQTQFSTTNCMCVSREEGGRGRT
jgi:hypothetical protein